MSLKETVFVIAATTAMWLFLMTLLHLKSTGLILEQVIKYDEANILFAFVCAGLAVLWLVTHKNIQLKLFLS